MNVNNILTNFWGSIKTYLSGNYQPKGSYANSSHTHDDRYYTETEVNTKLSGKSDTSHNHDSTYVKLTGDQSISGSKTFNNNITLNGSLNLQNSVDNVCLRVQGGSGENKGSRLILSGKDRSGLNGAFELLATDGTSHSLLKGLPSGSLTWQDKNIALDDNVVHKTGNEGISGVKIFHNVVVGEQDGLIRIGGNLEGGHYCTLNYDGLFYGNQKQFVPKTNNEYNLGTSSNKWKTINGINPGALSLPDASQGIDLKSHYTNQGDSWVMEKTGWLLINCINVTDGAKKYLNAYGGCVHGENYGGSYLLLPVLKGGNVTIFWSYQELNKVILFPCQGNV